MSVGTMTTRFAFSARSASTCCGLAAPGMTGTWLTRTDNGPSTSMLMCTGSFLIISPNQLSAGSRDFEHLSGSF